MAIRRQPNPEEARDQRTLSEIFRDETVGAVVLVLAVAVALIVANSRLRTGYHTLRSTALGPHVRGLRLTLGQWATDGLFTLFFVVAGLEIRRETHRGSLSTWRRASLPVVAAVGGMAVAGLIYRVVTIGSAFARGWAIPTSTDLAFCLALLALFGRRLPVALRTFLLTLAVVDDVLAIVLMGALYSKSIRVVLLAATVVVLAVFAGAQRYGWTRWWTAWPLALGALSLASASGLQPTVVGAALGLLASTHESPSGSAVERYEHYLRPFSAGLAVPAFAFFVCGVPVHAGTVNDLVSNRGAVAMLVARLVGKPLGVAGATWVLSRFTRAELDPSLGGIDVVRLGILCSVGFSVSLLVNDVAFGRADLRTTMTTAIIMVSLVCSLVAAVALRLPIARHPTPRRAR